MLFAGKLKFTIGELSQCSKHRCSLSYVGPRFLYRHIKIPHDMETETHLEEQRRLKGGREEGDEDVHSVQHTTLV